MTYTLTQNEFVVLDGSIYFDPAGDSQEAAAYALWIADGNTPEPYIAPMPPVPTVVSSTQAKIALAGAGLFDQIDDFMAALPKADPRRIAWTTAAEFTRDSPTLAAVAQQLSLSSAQVDALFAAADAITV